MILSPLGVSHIYSVKEQHGGCSLRSDTIALCCLTEKISCGENLHCCSCGHLCDGGWGTPAEHVTFWNETQILLALLFSIDDTLIILECPVWELGTSFT